MIEGATHIDGNILPTVASGERAVFELFGKKYYDVLPTLDRIVEQVETMAPNLWKQIYTRHCDAPGSYRGYKAVACTLATGWIAQSQDHMAPTNIPLLAKILMRYDYPVYHLSKDLFAAIVRSHPPEGMKWSEIAFPFDALMFMLPVGLLKEPHTGNNIYCLGVAKLNKDTVRHHVKEGSEHHIDEGRINVFYFMDPAGLSAHDCCFPLDQHLEPDPEWINKATQEQNISEDYGVTFPPSEFNSYIAGLVANLLLVMMARPELIERGEQTGRRMKKTGVPIVGPTFLGRKYAIQKVYPNTQSSGAHFTELRWRAGHFRRQPCGAGRLDRRTIWIDPYCAYSAGLVREEAMA